MKRQEIEKRLKTIIEEGCILRDDNKVVCGQDVLDDIFDDVIKEILSNIISFHYSYSNKLMKQQAKELYNITLQTNDDEMPTQI